MEQDYCVLLIVDMFIIDVCVFIEFEYGVMFVVINLLLMNNDECVVVGICYKQ